MGHDPCYGALRRFIINWLIALQLRLAQLPMDQRRARRARLSLVELEL
jgi:hypothetical protein